MREWSASLEVQIVVSRGRVVSGSHSDGEEKAARGGMVDFDVDINFGLKFP